MKQTVQTLYARILEDIRAEMGEAETLYLKLCQTAIADMLQSAEADPASSGRRIRSLSEQYSGKLQSIIRDVSMVCRSPIQVYPVADGASVLETLETYNTQFKELERILERLCMENGVPKNSLAPTIQARN